MSNNKSIINYILYLLYAIIIAYFIYSWRIYNYYFERELLDYSERLWSWRYDKSLQNYTTHSLFNVEVYTNDKREEPLSNYMIIINPQRLYFFIERGRIIYHPHPRNNNDEVLKQYACQHSDEFELAYLIPVTKTKTSAEEEDASSSKPPVVICHRKLSYLVKNIYTSKVYFYNYTQLQKPLVVLSDVLNRLLKINSIKKYIYT